MQTRLPKLEAWKKRVRQLVAEGQSDAEAVKTAIREDVARYVAVLQECGYSDSMVVDNLRRHSF